MELKWLEDFCCLAGCLSFSRAAYLRGVTQPAFSRRIKQLEGWMGATLVNRATFPITLTAEGVRFLPMAEDAIRTMHRNRDSLRPRHEAEKHRVTFSALHTLTVTFLPAWLDDMRAHLPLFSSHVSPDKGGIEENIDTLLDGNCDFLLTYFHPSVPFLLDSSRFSFLVLGTEKVKPVAAPHPHGPLLDHALKTHTPLPYIDYGDFSFFGMALNKLFAKRQPFARNTTHENTICIGHKAMALAGWGVSWLPERLVAAELADGALVPASVDPDWELTTEIRLYRHADGARPIANRFWEAAANSAGGVTP
ncbi:LysR substrate-binding domain-containing protein [Mesorhizobium shangrilense]|uniref:LysR substrate-binding domain-containing protein n=1 Tax=Mesorhizobium shangrilense TaxID=460060 RepID=A0ABV2DMZ8_9HYPH